MYICLDVVEELLWTEIKVTHKATLEENSVRGDARKLPTPLHILAEGGFENHSST